MGRFNDSRLEEIFQYRTCDELPREVCIAAHRKARLLFAARSFTTLSLFADPQPAPDEHFTIAVHKHWHIRFRWDAAQGAIDMALQRL